MALVLSRRIGEKLKIGNDVSLTITRVRGRTVTLALDAPQSTRIIRAELDCHEGGDGKQGPGETQT